MRIFISGGCKNGKSYYAQRLAKAQQANALYYVATMHPADSEDEERIAKHRQERLGWNFTTVEQPVNIGGILQKCDPSGSFLLDSLTALLANEMFPPSGLPNEGVADRVTDGLLQVLRKVADIVIVSDYLYSDAALYDPLTEKYRKALASLDRTAAHLCEVVLEVAYTHVITHKGKEAFDVLYQKIL